jgi:hypothetical protein
MGEKIHGIHSRGNYFTKLTPFGSAYVNDATLISIALLQATLHALLAWHDWARPAPTPGHVASLPWPLLCAV